MHDQPWIWPWITSIFAKYPVSSALLSRFSGTTTNSADSSFHWYLSAHHIVWEKNLCMYYRDELFMCLLACWITLSWGQQFAPLVHILFFINNDTGIILRMGSSNERRRDIVTAFAIGWAQTQMILAMCVATTEIKCMLQHAQSV